MPEDFVNYKVQSKEIVDSVAEKICMSSRRQYAIYSARRHSFVLKRKKKKGNHQCWESKLDHSPHQSQMLTKSRTELDLARILDQEQILQLTTSSIKIGP